MASLPELIVILITVLQTNLATQFELSQREQKAFSEWRRVFYDKKYLFIDQDAYESWLNNYHMVESHNKLFEEGLSTYELQLNYFAEISDEGFNEAVYGPPFPDYLPIRQMTPHDWNKLARNSPPRVDWRKLGPVTEVRYQGMCASGWAFAAAGAAEALYFNRTGYRGVSFSAQQLIDCVPDTYGCRGGSHVLGLNFYKFYRGISRYEYRQTRNKERCKQSSRRTLSHSRIGDVKTLFLGDELALQASIAVVGPVAATFTVTDHFRFYRTGVFNDPLCAFATIKSYKHSALIVGYGTNSLHGDYWIVKNSFGPEWGEDGYIRMARNSNNSCGIASAVSFPRNGPFF